MSAVPRLDEAITLKSITVDVTLPPRFARRLRATAYDRRRSVPEILGSLVAKGLVPDAHERKRLIQRDCEDTLESALLDVLGDDHECR